MASSKILDAIREVCKPAIWSRGVELVREGALRVESRDADECVLMVSVTGALRPQRVYLFFDDLEWDCNCPAKFEVCEHVAAAALALEKADREGGSLEEDLDGAGRVIYLLHRDAAGLGLERRLRIGESETLLLAPLARIASGRVPGLRVQPTQADLAIDLLLDQQNPQTPGPNLIPKLFGRLQQVGELAFEGTSVKVSAEVVGPRVVLEDEGQAFLLRLEESADVDERFGNGVVRIGDTFHPYSTPSLTARERDDFLQGRRIGMDAVGELVDRTLPDLRRRTTVEIRTERLPGTVVEAPRINFLFEAHGTDLSVLPTLVYGDPVRARIDSNRLIHIEGALPQRDENEEYRLLRTLQTELDLTPGNRLHLEGPEAVAFRKRWMRFDAGGKTKVTEPPALQSFQEAPPLIPRWIEGDVSFDSPRSDGGASGADAGEVLAAFRRGDSLVPLREGGWAELPADWLGRYGETLADLLAARAAGVDTGRLMAAGMLELCEGLNVPAPPNLLGWAERLGTGVSEATLPDDLQATLRPYQRRGIDWLAMMRDEGLGALLADDMGLGKTLQALAVLPAGRSLVVAPTSVLPNWQAEIERFRPQLRVNVYHGPKRQLDDQADLTLTSYAILRIDQQKLAKRTWDWICLDEAQMIKNPDSRVARAAFTLRGKARVVLTGTPVENRLDELWSLFQFLVPGLLGSREDFDERYGRPIVAGEPEVASRLRRRIRPFLKRRLKEDVAPDLPPRTEIVQRIDLDEKERTLYESIHAATRKEVLARFESGGGVMKVLEALLRLRQAACHPSLVPGQKAERSTKVELLMDLLETVHLEGHKALVFSQWTSLLDLVQEALESRGSEYVRLDGSTRDRGAVVDSFQSVTGPPTMLISLRAGGTGLNLTEADHVFILDPWWNPAAERQAADRAHRIGQQRPVMIYRLVARDTVEERVLKLQEKKQSLADAAVGEGSVDASLNREELLDLLR